MKRIKLSKHFYRDEFACQCGCGFDTVDHELVKILEDVRKTFNAPVHISSGCRCEKHNADARSRSRYLCRRGFACFGV